MQDAVMFHHRIAHKKPAFLLEKVAHLRLSVMHFRTATLMPIMPPKKSTESHTRNRNWGPTLRQLVLAPAASGEIEPMFRARPLKLAFRRNCEDGMGGRIGLVRGMSRTFL